MYFLALLVLYSFAYVGVFLMLGILFREAFSFRFPPDSLRSLAVIALSAAAAFGISVVIPDVELGNRFLHAIGGGFIASLVCFRAMKDGGFQIGKLRFFIIIALVVTFLGAANEMAEFFLQTYTHMVFTNSVTDTWLDLMSNWAGIALAGLTLTPFVQSTRKA